MAFDTTMDLYASRASVLLIRLGAMLRWGGLAIFLLAAVPDVSLAQTATVRGFVVDVNDGEALQGVNIVLENDDGIVTGTATNTDGFYTLPQFPIGTYYFRASFIGYQSYRDTLTFAPGQIISLSVELEPEASELDELIVESERSTGTARLTAGQQSVTSAEIELVPAPDVSGDLANYLATLPGVVTTGDRGGQIFIRGGEPTQNLVRLDGMVVYQPFHILGFYSAFPSDVLTRAEVYAGGYGSKYGGRISSVIEVSTRNGNKRAYNGGVSLAPFISSARLEGPIVDDKVSFLVSVRQSVIEQVAEQYVDEPLPFDFGDTFAKVHAKFTDTSQLSVTSLSTHDRGTVLSELAASTTPDGVNLPVNPDEVAWRNRATGLRWLVLPKEHPILVELLVNGSQLETEQGNPEDPNRESSVGRIHGGVNVTYYSPRIDWNWGFFAQTLEIESKLGGLWQNVETRKEYLTEVGIYLEPEIELTSSLKLRPGLRMQSFQTKGTPFLEPRFRFIWEEGAHMVSGAFGVYHQEIVGLSDRRDATSVFTAWAPLPLGDLPKATHFILGYRVSPNDWFEFAIEGFAKRLKNLFISEWTAFPRFTTRLQPADGNVVGLDTRIEIRLPNFYGYINYGLSSVEYEAQQSSLLLWYGTETLKFRPSHDRRHQVNALASTSLKGFDFSVRWQFGSGLPYNRALGFDGFLLMNGDVDVAAVQGTRRVIYERPFNGELPTYHRLDVSVERTFSLERASMTVQASAINTYDRNNLFFLDVFTLRRVNQLPFVPTLGIKLEFE